MKRVAAAVAGAVVVPVVFAVVASAVRDDDRPDVPTDEVVATLNTSAPVPAGAPGDRLGRRPVLDELDLPSTPSSTDVPPPRPPAAPAAR